MTLIGVPGITVAVGLPYNIAMETLYYRSGNPIKYRYCYVIISQWNPYNTAMESL
jgi:hypothetical protein